MILLVVSIGTAGRGHAQQSVMVGNGDVPTPSKPGSFDELLGGGPSVIVDDSLGGEFTTDVGEPEATPQDFGPDPMEWPVCGQTSAEAGLFGLWCDECRGRWCDARGACGGDACGDLCHDGCRPGCLWAIQADALVLWRGNTGAQPLFQDTLGATVLDAGDVRTAATAGPRIGVVRSLGCGRAVEGNYFNVGGIQGSTATTGVGAPYASIGLADLALTGIDAAEYTTRGQIKSAELNYRWSQGRRVIWLAGFRWVEWNEIGSVTYTPQDPDAPAGTVAAQVGNDLYGGQFGCRLRLWDLRKWQVSTVGKAGAYTNTAFQRTSATPSQPTISDTSDDVAFFGEVGVNSTLWITHWLAWRAGYSFFWLDGVATAAQQLPLGSFSTATTSINTNGSVYLQGFSTGLETRW